MTPQDRNSPSVTVVMAVFNGGDYLQLALNSIIQQTYDNFEFVIVNDGSTDSSLEVLTEFSKRDGRIRLISRENRGLVASLNEGIAIAKAPLIARMDADDIAHPERLQKQVDFMKNNVNVVCVGSYYDIIDEDGLKLTSAKAPVTDELIQRALIRGHTVICHPTAMYRTDAVNAAGGYEQRFFLVEDLDLWLKLGEIGELANIPEPLLSYRTNSNSVSTQNGKIQLEKAESVIREASIRRNVENKFELKKHWRPNETKESQMEFALKYGWWAFNSDNKKAALKYAKKAIGIKPFSSGGWKLLLSTAIKLRDIHE